jgi:DNA mismatch endonuclease (patch repair protein)
MDKVSVQQRSRNMAAVRSRNTAPEMLVRSILHAIGLRFRLHQISLPSSPDIVLKRHRTIVLVHGCFWHGHSCRRGKQPTSRPEFWGAKLAGNRARDERQIKELKALGWRVLIVWECETVDALKLTRRLVRLFHVGDPI